MKTGSQRVFRRVGGTVLAFAFGMATAGAQQAPQAATGTAQKQPMSEDVFKNVQVLRGIPVPEFMETMGFFAASLSMNCTDCHVAESGGNWARYADDTPLKQTARRMVVMMRQINKSDFVGNRQVTCYTCHRGFQLPEITPSLSAQYAEPPPLDPDKVEVIPESGTTGPSVDAILNKYIQALGGAQQLAKVTSVVGKGTYTGFDTDFTKVPVDVYAKAPDLRATVVHRLDGDNTTVYDGHDAWVSAVDKPVPLYPLLGEDLDGASVDAFLFFPAQIKDKFKSWQTGFPEVELTEGHPTEVIEGTMADGTKVKFYFDKTTGLLMRQSRSTDTIIGITPTHVEYSDYRTVSGIKIPFHWTVTWVDGQSTTDLTQAQANVAIDAAKFAKPSPAVQKPAAPPARAR
jgi:photosynthetic reaction center cytochrome c subunit